MAAYLEESNIILPRHISHAVKSLNHSEMKMQDRMRIAPLSAGIVVILLFMVLAVSMLVRRYHETPVEPIGAAVDHAQKPSETITVTDVNDNSKHTIVPEPSSQNKGLDPIPMERQDKDVVEKKSRTQPEIDDEETASGSKPVSPLPQKDAPQYLPYKILSIKVDVANVRDEPSLDSLVIGKLLKKAQLVAYQEYVDDSSAKWYEVSFRGKRRWIAEEVVDVLDISTNDEPSSS